MNELISVYITARNRPDLLKRAIESVILQTYPNIEIIVVDDASDFSLKEVVLQFKNIDGRSFLFFRNNVRRGACFSRNLAINNASGKYITGLDDDDAFVKERIEVLFNSYQPIFSFVAANDKIINADGSNFISARPNFVSYEMILDSGENLVGNQIFTETYKLRDIGGFDLSFPALQDFEAYFRMLYRFGVCKVVREPLQIIYKNDSVVRITGHFNQLQGVLRFYLKNRSKLTLRQKKVLLLKYFLFKSLFLKSKCSKLSLFYLIFFSNRFSLKRNIKFYLSLISYRK